MAADLKPASWTSFAKKRDLDDGAFVKALTALDKIRDTDHGARVPALESVAEQAQKMIVALARRKPPLPDKDAKEIKDKLYAFHELAERQTKVAKAAEAATADGDGEDEDDDSPALLGAKMIPLLRALRKPGVEMHAMIATAGRECAVLIMRRSISPSRRKMLAEAVDAKGGTKYIAATCLFENNALTFVVQASAGGLAKKVRAALLKQTELRVKVRVRGDDGEDDDGEAADDEASAVPDAPPSSDGDTSAFDERRRRLQADVDAALKDRHPESTKLRGLMGFVSEKADAQQDPAAAGKALDQVEKLLGAAPKPASAGSAGNDPRAAAFTARLTALLDKIKAAASSNHPQAARARDRVTEASPFARSGDWDAASRQLELAEALLSTRAGGVAAPAVVYTQSRLVWGATRKKIRTEMQKLESAILDAYRGNAAYADVVAGVRKLDVVLERFDDSLENKLDAALNASEPQEKLRWHDEAREVISAYQGYLASDPIVRELDGNPFVPIAVQATLTSSLATLAAKIV